MSPPKKHKQTVVNLVSDGEDDQDHQKEKGKGWLDYTDDDEQPKSGSKLKRTAARSTGSASGSKSKKKPGAAKKKKNDDDDDDDDNDFVISSSSKSTNDDDDDDDDDDEEFILQTLGKKKQGPKTSGAAGGASALKAKGGITKPTPKSNVLIKPKTLGNLSKQELSKRALEAVTKLREELKLKDKNSKLANGGRLMLTAKDFGIENVLKEVEEMTNTEVMEEILKLAADVTSSILGGNGFSIQVPTRSASNQCYIEELDRIVLKDKVSSRSFGTLSTVRKSAITMRVLQLVYELCSKNIHVTKRDLFYTDVKLFKAQLESDEVLNDIACTLGCTRTSLSVVASEKGIVIGRLQFNEAGDEIDCTRMGIGGKAIPPFVDKITNLRSDALFIMLVEKDAAFMRLAEDRFYNKYPCIIITAKGQPDVATRLFLKKLRMTLQIPILGLVDSDPYGLKILSVYMSGSKNMSYDSANLTTPDIKWLGVRPSDLDRYDIPEQCRLDMSEHDIRTGKEMLEEDFIKKNPAWYEELELMVKRKQKAEIQALSNFGFQYLTEEYLPRKLAEMDWV